MNLKITLMTAVLAISSIIVSQAKADYTPGRTVKAAYKAAKKNNLKAFRHELSGNALAKFGNAQGLEIARTQAEGVKKLETQTSLVSTVRANHFVQTVSKVSVFGDRQDGRVFVGQAEVFCSVPEHHRHVCGPRAHVRGCISDYDTVCAITDVY